jgi:hypothetical protein
MAQCGYWKVARAQPIFDALLPPTAGIPVATSNPGDGGRRQLNAGGPDSGGLRPALAAFGDLPAVLRSAAAVMADRRPFRLMQTPIPCVSFPEDTPRGRWTGHVDWGESAAVHMRSSALHTLWRFGVIHFTTVQPGGGAFTVVPRSHRLIMRCIEAGVSRGTRGRTSTPRESHVMYCA